MNFPHARQRRTRNGVYMVQRTRSGDQVYRATLKDLRKPSVVFHPERDDEKFFMHTFLDDKRVVAAGQYGLYLIDVETMKTIRRFSGHSGPIRDVAVSPDGRHFLSGSADQTVRVWDPEREEPLLSLFLADTDWVAWTPEGYYATSAGGEHFMGWQVGTGLEALATYFPAAQFRKSLYRPDAIKRLLQAGTIAKAIALAGKEPVANVGQVMPPLAAITFPPGPSGYRFSGTRLEVKAAARSSGNHPVTALRLAGRRPTLRRPGGPPGHCLASPGGC